jgi:hypothetical protein
MSKWAVVIAACLIWPGAACAGQATSQFQVGITITGKPAAAPAGANAATAPAQTTTEPAATEKKLTTQTRNSRTRSRRQMSTFGTAAPPVTSR